MAQIRVCVISFEVVFMMFQAERNLVLRQPLVGLEPQQVAKVPAEQIRVFGDD